MKLVTSLLLRTRRWEAQQVDTCYREPSIAYSAFTENQSWLRVTATHDCCMDSDSESIYCPWSWSDYYLVDLIVDYQIISGAAA